MIVCPRCSYKNEDSAMNCANCRINLQWALENLQEAAQRDLQSVGKPPPEAQAANRAARGCMLIVLLLAIPASAVLAFVNLLSHGYTPDSKEQLRSGYMTGAWFWLVVAVVCLLVAIAMLLPGRLRPRYYRGLRILALVALTGGLLFGLMRLTLVILPEHTERSLIIQYKLGERDFRGANLEQAGLTGADLHEANLSGADLKGADLTGAQLYRTDLGGADLRGANLTEANLIGADLREADLTGADLTGANLERTILRGADLSGAAVTNEQLDRAWNLEGTILPDGSVHE